MAGAAIPLAALVAAVVLGSGSILPSAVGSSSTPSPAIAVVATSTPADEAMAAATPSPIPSGTVLDVGPTPSPTPPPPTPPSQLTGYVWPLDKASRYTITLTFGPSEEWGEFLVDGELFHDGLDIATNCGDRVKAAHDGVVLTAGRDYVDFLGWQGDLTAFKKRFSTPKWKSGLPIVIVIDDGNGYRSIYGHESKVAVKAGQHVKAGQVIGYEGATGHATGCHVHFGLFSPLETATFANLPKYMAYPDRLPATITARVDPLLVLPYRNDIASMRVLRPDEAAAWDLAHS